MVAYVVAASFGTAVELAELAHDELTGGNLTADTPWDLFANSSGALLAAVVLEGAGRLVRTR